MGSRQRGRSPNASARRWECHPNAIVCEAGDHLLAFYEHGYRCDMRAMSGHEFLKCTSCGCTFLAVFSPLPSPIVYCFAMSAESYKRWDSRPDSETTPPTDELLYHITDPDGLRHNPWWRPPVPRRS